MIHLATSPHQTSRDILAISYYIPLSSTSYNAGQCTKRRDATGLGALTGNVGGLGYRLGEKTADIITGSSRAGGIADHR